MNKAFFETLHQRAREFGERTGLGDDVRVEVILHGPRTYVLEKVIEASESMVQFDGWDPSDDEHVSMVVPYNIVANVMLTKVRRRAREAGFKIQLAPDAT